MEMDGRSSMAGLGLLPGAGGSRFVTSSLRATQMDVIRLAIERVSGKRKPDGEPLARVRAAGGGRREFRRGFLPFRPAVEVFLSLVFSDAAAPLACPRVSFSPLAGVSFGWGLSCLKKL
jgi:hypothetical protein